MVAKMVLNLMRSRKTREVGSSFYVTDCAKPCIPDALGQTSNFMFSLVEENRNTILMYFFGIML